MYIYLLLFTVLIRSFNDVPMSPSFLMLGTGLLKRTTQPGAFFISRVPVPVVENWHIICLFASKMMLQNSVNKEKSTKQLLVFFLTKCIATMAPAFQRHFGHASAKTMCLALQPQPLLGAPLLERRLPPGEACLADAPDPSREATQTSGLFWENG